MVLLRHLKFLQPRSSGSQGHTPHLSFHQAHKQVCHIQFHFNPQNKQKQQQKASFPLSESLRTLCEEFNAWSDDLRRRRVSATAEDVDDASRPRASHQLLNFLLPFIYNRAVKEPAKLNQYKGFSPQVYGETGIEVV